ncbi:hypothetical protein MMC11_003260 [Xylographa trunciseda]|nr:hypothetical protein [Xylographa trunciseda]
MSFFSQMMNTQQAKPKEDPVGAAGARATKEAHTAKNTKTPNIRLQIADTTDGDLHSFARRSNIALDELEKDVQKLRRIARKNKDWVIVRNIDVIDTRQAVDREKEKRVADRVVDEIDDWVIVP